jgi:hypothetical protein
MQPIKTTASRVSALPQNRNPARMPRLVTHAWLKPLFVLDQFVYCAICGEDSNGHLTSHTFRGKVPHVRATIENIQAFTPHATFSCSYRFLCDFGFVLKSKVFTTEKTNRYAKMGTAERTVFTVTVQECVEIVISMTKLPNSMSTWVNSLRAYFDPPGLKHIRYGGAFTAAHLDFVRPHMLVQPICYKDIIWRSVGSPGFFKWLEKLLELAPHDAAAKLAFDPGCHAIPDAATLSLLESAAPSSSNPLLHSVLSYAARLQKLAFGVTHPQTCFSAHKKVEPLLPSFTLDAFETRVDAASGAFIVWGPSPETAFHHWTGPLADCPAGLVLCTTPEGFEALCVYPTSVKRAYAKLDKVLLSVLYVKRGDAYADARECHTTLLLPKVAACMCLSANADGAFCPVPLKHASTVPYVLTNAIVDAAAGWTARDMLALLSCFKKVHFFNGTNTTFRETLNRLCSQSPVAEVSQLHRAPAVHYDTERELSVEPEFEFAELPDEILAEQARQASDFRESYQSRSKTSL